MSFSFPLGLKTLLVIFHSGNPPVEGGGGSRTKETAPRTSCGGSKQNCDNTGPAAECPGGCVRSQRIALSFALAATRPRGSPYIYRLCHGTTPLAFTATSSERHTIRARYYARLRMQWDVGKGKEVRQSVIQVDRIYTAPDELTTKSNYRKPHITPSIQS